VLEHKTKVKLAECYLQLCAEKNSSKISVRELTTAAQVNRQTFYYHFKDIQALLHWIYCQDALKYLIEEQVALDNWEEQVFKLLKSIYQKRFFYKMVLLENRESVMQAFFPIIEQVFRQLFRQVDEEEKLSENDHQFYSRFFSFGCCGILETWIKEDYPEQPVAIAAQLFQLAKDIELFSYRIYQRIEEEQGGLS
jgi:Transcriptional regulator